MTVQFTGHPHRSRLYLARVPLAGHAGRLEGRCLCDAPIVRQAERCPRCARRYVGRTWQEVFRDTAIATIPWVMIGGVACMIVVGILACLQRFAD
jgi:hypothetical protein